MISPSASTKRESTAPQTVGRNAKISHDREVIKRPDNDRLKRRDPLRQRIDGDRKQDYGQAICNQNSSPHLLENSRTG